MHQYEFHNHVVVQLQHACICYKPHECDHAAMHVSVVMATEHSIQCVGHK